MRKRRMWRLLHRTGDFYLFKSEHTADYQVLYRKISIAEFWGRDV